MPIDWHYHRPGCTTCQKMQAFLSGRSVEPAAEVVNATKTRYDGPAALELARTADRLVVAKGRQVVDFDMQQPPDDETLLKHLLGPTGNLRAPTLRIGDTLVIGFNEPEFSKLFAELGV